MMPPRAFRRSTANFRKRSDDAPRHCAIARREMRADVAIGQRAEDGIDQRMQHDVGI